MTIRTLVRYPMNHQGHVAILPYGAVTLTHQGLTPYRNPPETLRDHLKKRRAESGLIQKDVAQQLGVNESTYLLWEHDRTFPNIRMWPTVIRFLGYYPFSKPQTLSDRLIAFRRLRSLSIKELARQLGIDEATLAKWENGEREPAGNRMEIVDEFLWPYGLLAYKSGTCWKVP